MAILPADPLHSRDDHLSTPDTNSVFPINVTRLRLPTSGGRWTGFAAGLRWGILISRVGKVCVLRSAWTSEVTAGIARLGTNIAIAYRVFFWPWPATSRMQQGHGFSKTEMG
jgi:hypothetical protein